MGDLTEVLLPIEAVPDGGAVLNPFVIVDDAVGFISTAMFDTLDAALRSMSGP